MEDDHRIIRFGHPHLLSNDIDAVKNVLESGWLRYGPKIVEAENFLARYCGAEDCVLVSSCTSALYLCLKYFDIAGKHVIMPSFTFGAVCSAVILSGGIPLFVDTYPDLPIISVQLLKKYLNQNIGAIIVVHQFGMAAEVDQILFLTREYGKVPLIEDCAYGVGTYLDGRHVGTFGDMGCMSFGILKPITCGEGGAILCGDKEVGNNLRIAREYGMLRSKSGEKMFIQEGGNFKLTEFQGALLLSQFQRVNEITSRKKWIHDTYKNEFSFIRGIRIIPKETQRTNSAFIIIDVKETGQSAELISRKIRQMHVEVETYIPLHQEPFFKRFAEMRKGEFSNTEDLSQRLIALPSHNGISETDIKIIRQRFSKVLDELGYISG